jgi:hypothetical protein
MQRCGVLNSLDSWSEVHLRQLLFAGARHALADAPRRQMAGEGDASNPADLALFG